MSVCFYFYVKVLGKIVSGTAKITGWDEDDVGLGYVYEADILELDQPEEELETIFETADNRDLLEEKIVSQFLASQI